MKLTNAMKDFIQEYVNQNMSTVYDMTHYNELEADLREELRMVTASLEADLQECLNNFVKRHPEFEGATVDLKHAYPSVITHTTPAGKAYSKASSQHLMDKDLLIKRMYASVGALKTMEELVEAMDALLAEFKE
jgi:hypothetical protein